eukprot:gene10645-19387_t
MDKLKFRKATTEDYFGIKELSIGVYNDTDYATASLPQWLTDLRWVIFVAEDIRGQIVGFVAFHLIDDCRTVVERSARLEKSYRGRGVFIQFYKFAISSLKEQYPLQSEISARVVVPIGHKVLLQRSYMTVLCRLESNEKLLLNSEGKCNDTVNETSPFKFLAQAMLDCHTCKHTVFRNGIVVIGDEIYRLSCESDVQYLISRPKLFCVTKSQESNDGNEDCSHFHRIPVTPCKENPKMKANTSNEPIRSGEKTTFCHDECLGDNNFNCKCDRPCSTSQSTDVGTAGCRMLSKRFALLDLTRRDTNLGFPLYSVDFYGSDVAWATETVVSLVRAGWEEAESKTFYLTVQTPLDFEEEMQQTFRQLGCCEVMYRDKMYMLERDLR